MILRAFYEMVRDGKISSEGFATILENNLPFETDEGILTDALNFADNTLFWTPQAFQQELSSRLFQLIFKLMQNNTEPNNKTRNTYLRTKLINLAKSDEDIEILFKWYEKKEPRLEAYELTVYDQWNIVKKVHRSGRISKEEKVALFKKQAAADNSELAVLNEKECTNLLISNEKERAAAWEAILNKDNKDSVRLITQSMKGFNNERLELKAYHDLFFNLVVDVFRTRNKEFSKAFFDYLFPISDDFDYLIAQLESLLNKCGDVELLTLHKMVQESLDNTERRFKACECFTLSRSGNEQKK